MDYTVCLSTELSLVTFTYLVILWFPVGSSRTMHQETCCQSRLLANSMGMQKDPVVGFLCVTLSCSEIGYILHV